MSRTSCIMCGTPCVGCARICRCGLNEISVKTTNSIIEENSIIDKDIINNIKLLARNNSSKDYIVSNMYKEIEEQKPLPKNDGYCEYKKGSFALGRWAECMRCGEPRFVGEGKKCKALSEL